MSKQVVSPPVVRLPAFLDKAAIGFAIIALIALFAVAGIAPSFSFVGRAESPAAVPVGELDGYRWTEMAKGYERLGLLTDGQSPVDGLSLDGYRWTEMAKGYERLGLLNDGR